MVTLFNRKLSRKSIGPLVAMAALFAAAPRVVGAQGVLEKMQDEVSAIALRTKSAVVTISAPGNYAYEVEQTRETSEEAKQRAAAAKREVDELSRAYFNLDVEETGARAKLKALRQKYAETDPRVMAQREKSEALYINLAVKKAELDGAKIRQNAEAQIKGYRVFRTPDFPYSPNGPGTVQGAGRQAIGAKTGSGFSIGDGYIVTTADVLDGMKDPIVTTDSGIRVRAKIVGVDKDLNVGLVQLLAKVDLPALALGDSAKVAVGHFAISVGQQSGQANSVALMLVGGLRTDGMSAGGHFYPNLIQIAGTVGAGISGAPLVNARGEVIGVMAGVPAASPLSNTLSSFNNTPGLSTTWHYSDNFPALRITQPPAGDPYVVAPPLPPGDHLDTLPTLPLDHNADKVPTLPPDARLNALPKADNSNKKSVPVLGEIPLVGRLFRKDDSYNNLMLNWSNGEAAAMEAAPVTSAGFAVPINALKPVLDELKNGKVIGRGWIGISPNDAVTTTEKAGVIYATHYVTAEGVYPDSPAFLAGILPGDALIRLNNAPLKTANDVREASQRLRPGDTLKVAYRRASQPVREVTLTITARPATFKTPLTLPATPPAK